jgi:chemotaxis protein methyltransferase CheR
MSAAIAFDQPLPGISPGIYGAADFRAVAEIVHGHAGIVLPAGKAMLVYSRLAPLVRETGSGTFAAYVQRMREDPVEQARAIAALTTNHTFFYRESHHFEHFAREARPALLSRLAARQPVRLWSAGCSSGEETWSLVMTLLGPDKLEGRRIAGKDVKVLASDIAPHALRKAEAATYAAKDLEAVPAELRDAWTVARGDRAEMADTPRSLVRFRGLNLQGDWPMRGKFNIIFCRNVMIYFDNPTKERLVARFTDMLVPGGYLYIGHSERVTGPAGNVLQPVGPTIYRRRTE